MLLGDGGQAQGVHADSPIGTVLAHVDSYNAFRYNGNTPTNIGSLTLPTPAWQPMFRADNITGRNPNLIIGPGNVGVGEIAEHPGNTNYFMAFFDGAIWISADRGNSWARTSQTLTFAVNGGPIQTQWIRGDPNDATGATWIVNTPSQGAFRTTNATLLGSATFTPISGVTASTGTGCGGAPCGGSAFFDLATSGGAQKIWISSDNVGIYECNSTASSCTLLNSAGMPTRSGVLIGDKFGQLWSGTGFTTPSFNASVYASGAWSTKSLVNGNPHSNQYMISILFDPNTGGSVAANRVIGYYSFGDMCVSLNNGTSCTDVLNSSSPFSSSGNQAAWLGTATQFSGFYQMNSDGASIDASGTIWAAGGISVWTAPNPIVSGVVQTTVNWAANSIGIEQLVVTQIVEPPGSGPVTMVWDRGLIYNPIPGRFATVQYPQLTDILENGFSVDYALKSGSTAASLLITTFAGSVNYSAKSSDGGITWVAWPTLPPGAGAGGTVAVNTEQNWCVVPGYSGGAEATIYCTPNAGTNWYQVTGFTGTPRFVPPNNPADNTGQVALVAEKGSTGTFYFYDMANSRLYKTTNGNSTAPTVTLLVTNPATINNNGHVKLMMPPGQPTDLYLAGYTNATWTLWKSSSSGASGSWAACSGATAKGLDNVAGYGFGAPKPGGSGYPTLYLTATANNDNNYVYYYSTDACATINALNVPTSAQMYPLGSMDYPRWVTGSPNTYGRAYVGWNGSGTATIDMADACPYVKFNNVAMNQSLSGTSVTVTAERDGMVPVTGVNFYVSDLNGSNLVQVGSTQTGQSTYTVNLNATANAGSKLLRVSATGNGCTSFNQNYNTFATPVTLSLLSPANDNLPMWLEKVA